MGRNSQKWGQYSYHSPRASHTRAIKCEQLKTCTQYYTTCIQDRRFSGRQESMKSIRHRGVQSHLRNCCNGADGEGDAGTLSAMSASLFGFLLFSSVLHRQHPRFAGKQKEKLNCPGIQARGDDLRWAPYDAPSSSAGRLAKVG